MFLKVNKFVNMPKKPLIEPIHVNLLCAGSLILTYCFALLNIYTVDKFACDFRSLFRLLLLTLPPILHILWMIHLPIYITMVIGIILLTQICIRNHVPFAPYKLDRIIQTWRVYEKNNSNCSECNVELLCKDISFIICNNAAISIKRMIVVYSLPNMLIISSQE